ncbi:hypothetical protein L2E82_36880 [Cichorium intybus]|uniref:Uncharacterized protein n=1 Tax=Cichorium intybus TaxID=13427 RepID=A0ACB9ADM1_CICIN|nr:hypothetical protein L2E82_36880 [Cichorium intybus]
MFGFTHQLWFGFKILIFITLVGPVPFSPVSIQANSLANDFPCNHSNYRKWMTFSVIPIHIRDLQVL